MQVRPFTGARERSFLARATVGALVKTVVAKDLVLTGIFDTRVVLKSSLKFVLILCALEFFLAPERSPFFAVPPRPGIGKVDLFCV